MEEKECAFWLASLERIGCKKAGKIIEYFGSAKEAFYGKENHFEQIPLLSAKDREELVLSRNEASVKRQYEQMQKKGIQFVYNQEEAYPKRLQNLTDAPFALFYRGKLPDDRVKSVAIVGARNASFEGIALSKRFGEELAANGVQVISGMALGIDIAAQRGALRQICGKTYGVLGTGVDICYPRQHLETYLEIIKKGGVLSEFPIGSQALPFHFPLRNRIISGLSDGILVIEARKGSGSLITAELGLEQGKEIFVLPGNLTNPLYEGGNELLKNGACFVTKVRDILDGLGLFYDMDVMERKKKTHQTLETTEKIVYAMLSLEPIHISEIVAKTGLSLQIVMENLLSLQQKQLLERVGNSYYIIKL